MEVIFQAREILPVIFVDAESFPIVAQFELQVVAVGIEEKHACRRHRAAWDRQAQDRKLAQPSGRNGDWRSDRGHDPRIARELTWGTRLQRPSGWDSTPYGTGS